VTDLNPIAILRKDPSTLTEEEILAVMEAERTSGVLPGEMPLGLETERNRCLDSPAYLATEVLDPWYKRHFEPIHYQLLDEVMAPYLLGETVSMEGHSYDPTEYTGLMVLWSRSTIKSTMLKIIAIWVALYRKLRLGEDSRTMFCHQVLEKAIEHSQGIKEMARQHKRFRELFPEFARGAGEWDQKHKWRWPCFKTYMAAEWSFMCYGETSNKIGGHYTERLIDDWVTHDSVTTPQMADQSDARFKAMDNLRDRTRPYNPWLLAGTNYHYQDAYRRAEQRGGWLIWRVPGFTGSPKKVFEVAAIDTRTDLGRRKFKLAMKRLEKDPPGTLHFPKLLGWKELVRTARETGPAEFNCQIMLNPAPEGEQRFPGEILEQSWVEELPSPSEAWGFIRCDPAISEKRSADETAIIFGLIDWQGWRYLADGWVGRERRPTEIVRKMFDMAEDWRARGYKVVNIGIESVQYQEGLAQICRDGVPEREANYDGESLKIRKSTCPIRSIKRPPDMRKTERILEMDGPISRFELKFWKNCKIATKAMTQFKNFPHDRFDILDAVHDLWGHGTMAPARETTDAGIQMHPLMAELMRLRKKNAQKKLVGTNSTVQLATWN
jgi:hypothetical protein